MRYCFVLGLLGCLLVVYGVIESGWMCLSVWLGADFLVLSVAYGCGAHGVFGKRPDGVLPLGSRIFFLPFLIYTWLVWHLVRLVSREPMRNVVTDRLVVGRRLLDSEMDVEFENYVDLTAEFIEPEGIRRSSAYKSFPILDASAPSPEILLAAVKELRPGRTFIHCAQGHGRTGMFALAVLLHSGAVQSVDEGLRVLQVARPGIRLTSEQRRCIERYAELSA